MQGVVFGAGRNPALLLSTDLEPAARRVVHDILTALGGRTTSDETACTRTPRLHIARLRDHALRALLAELLPGDGVCCVRAEHVAQYCRDGVLRYRENQSDTEALLSPGMPVSLSGTLGTGLVRALSIGGVLVLHGAAFRYRGLTLLALGASGAGKTTLCAATLRAGGRVVSDDLVLLADPGRQSEASGSPWIRPFRADMLLRPDSRGLLPTALARSLQREERSSGPKLRLRRALQPDAFSEQERLSCVGILGPGPRQARSRVTRLGQADALVGVLCARLYQLSPIARAPLMAAATRLVSEVPVVQLDVGSHLLVAPNEELDRLCTDVAATIAATSPPRAGPDRPTGVAAPDALAQ